MDAKVLVQCCVGQTYSSAMMNADAKAVAKVARAAWAVGSTTC